MRHRLLRTVLPALGALALLALAAPARAEGIGDPAPDVRPRPPAPPPPEEVVRDWDRDHLAAGIGLGPPPPRVDPFPLRAIRYRPDAEYGSVTGRLLETRRFPQWVDVIERRDFVEWRPLDTGHLVGRLPNVTINDEGSPFLQIPGIRGFGGDRVKILTDGVWPSTQSLGSFGGTLSLWDPESIERVEVYHGAGAMLKAIDAPGGLINVVPRRPRRHGRGSADVHVASGWASADNRWRNRADVDWGSGRWAALVGATWTTVGDRDTGGGTLTPSEYDAVAADAAVDYFLTNRSRIGLTAQYVKAYDVETPLGVGSSAVQPGYDRFFLALTLTSFDVGSYFHGTRASIALDTLLSEDERELGTSGSGLSGENDVSRVDLHLEGTLQLFCCHTTYAELTVGYAKLDRTETLLCVTPAAGGPKPDPMADAALLRMADLGSTFAVLGSCTQATNRFEAEELAITGILQDECHNACWDWTGGLRGDFYSIDDDRVGGASETSFLLSGAGGLVRHLTRRLSVYGNASLGWRRPTIFELTSTEVRDGVPVFGNPDLDHELHANVELGTKMAMKDRWSLQTAVFGHYTDDFIGPVDLAGGTTRQLANKGDALLLGFETAAAWRPITTIEGLELFGTAATTRSDDESVVASVPFQWRTGWRYSVPQPQGYRVRRWFGEVALYGASNSADAGRGGADYVSADLLLGTGIDLRCGRGAWFNVGVTNLFDADYTTATSVLPVTGISFLVGGGIQF